MFGGIVTVNCIVEASFSINGMFILCRYHIVYSILTQYLVSSAKKSDQPWLCFLAISSDLNPVCNSFSLVLLFSIFSSSHVTVVLGKSGMFGSCHI